MAVAAEIKNCKVVLKYEKEGSSSYGVNSTSSVETLFDTANMINSLQATPASGIYKTTEEELISK